jgi:peptide/nickel transport system permease protein
MSAPTVPADAVPDVHTLEEAARTSLLRRLLKNPVGLISLGYLAFIVLVAILAPAIAPQDPNLASANDILAPPSSEHWLGADGSGRDILSRLIVATRISLLGALVTLVVSSVLGTTVGLIAGYYRGWFESSATWVASALQSLPGIAVLLAARSVMGPSVVISMSIFGILIAPAFYRVVFAAVSGVRNELYVDAARVFGLSDARIIARHILTVVRAPAIILAAGVAGISIAIQAGLDFLGLGQVDKPSWGAMLNNAFVNIFTAPLQLLWPSLAIGVTCIALVLLGNALRDELERSVKPRRRRRGAPADARPESHPVVVHDEIVATRGEELLSIRDLAVGYDQPDGTVKLVVQDVSLSVRRGEVHGLIGESGSGKTQTAFAVMRLLPPGGRIVHGTVDFEGTDLATLSDKKMVALRGRKIAYIPQEPMSNLDPTFTIGSQLVEPMRIGLKLSKAEAKQRALDLLARVGIPEPERTFASYPHQVSGGQAQRVLIAGAVSCNPDLLIADEPTTALDVTVQAEVLDLLRDLQKEFDMGVLLVTHNFGVVADICDRVSVMRGGRIVETGPTEPIFASPDHEYTQSLFGAVLQDSEPRAALAGVAAPDFSAEDADVAQDQEEQA